jgi:hypothetical protein
MRHYRIPSLLAVIVSGSLAACTGTEKPSDDEAKAKMAMANDLVQCRNDNQALKEKISDLTAELQKLRAQQAAAPEAGAGTAAPTTAAGNPTPAVASAHPKKMGAEGEGEADISPVVLGRVVKAKSPALRVCYEKGLKHNPNLQYVSSVKVHFSVNNTGAASDVSFSPHVDREMEKCMSSTIAKWQFPQFHGRPVEVEAPVSLIAK